MDSRKKDLSTPFLSEHKVVPVNSNYTSETTYLSLPQVIKEIVSAYLTIHTKGYDSRLEIVYPFYPQNIHTYNELECLAEKYCMSAFECGGKIKEAINPCSDSRAMTVCIDIACLPFVPPVCVLGLTLGTCGLFADGARHLNQKVKSHQYEKEKEKYKVKYEEEMIELESYLPSIAPPSQKMN
jgi:hypothetical protein